MTYFPKSQIKTNLHTNGGEYVLYTTGDNYIGYFYQISNGNKYTGKSPSNPPNILLQIQEESSTSPEISNPKTAITVWMEVWDYQSEANIQTRYSPTSIQPQPTKEDYVLGKFIRYFAKKNNENIYLEINKETHDQLKSKQSTIAWDLYSPILVIWTLTGDEGAVYLTNKKIVALAEKQNKWYGFTQWFKDNFSKYYLEPK